MDGNLERRVEHLEERLRHLEQQWTDERRLGARRLRRATWMRVAALLVVLVAYLLYAQFLTSVF